MHLLCPLLLWLAELEQADVAIADVKLDNMMLLDVCYGYISPLHLYQLLVAAKVNQPDHWQDTTLQPLEIHHSFCRCYGTTLSKLHTYQPSEDLGHSLQEKFCEDSPWLMGFICAVLMCSMHCSPKVMAWKPSSLAGRQSGVWITNTPSKDRPAAEASVQHPRPCRS